MGENRAVFRHMPGASSDPKPNILSNVSIASSLVLLFLFVTNYVTMLKGQQLELPDAKNLMINIYAKGEPY